MPHKKRFTRPRFRAVRRLDESQRACLACIASPGLSEASHHARHEPPTLPVEAPRRWRIVEPVEGDPIPVGSTLRLDAFEAYADYGVAVPFDSVTALLTVLDGPLRGRVLWTFASGEWSPFRLLLPKGFAPIEDE